MNRADFDALMDFVFCEHDRPSLAVRQKWWHLFGQLDRNLVMAAAKRLITYGKPKAADLQKALDDLRGLVSSAEGQDAETSWGLVLGAVSKFGSYRELDALAYIENRDPDTAEAVRVVGWKTICMSEQTDSAIRAHYWRIRQSVQKHSDAQRQLEGPDGDRIKDLIAGTTGEARPGKNAHHGPHRAFNRYAKIAELIRYECKHGSRIAKK